MERSRKIFCRIASASHRVAAAANDHADLEDHNGVSRYHFHLEEDMRRISVACECLAGTLDKPPPEEGPTVDVRIQDWLTTDEPQACLQTLSRMENLLRDTYSWIPRVFQMGRGSTAKQDKLKDAVELFSSCKGCFHFLFSTEIWNHEKAVRRPEDVSQRRGRVVQGEPGALGARLPQMEIKTAMSLNRSMRHDGQVDHIIQRGSDIVAQGLPTPTEVDIDTTALETVNTEDRHGVLHRKHKMKTGIRSSEEGKKIEEVLKWLDGLNCAEKHDMTSLLRQEDTCKWLLDTTHYKTWKDGVSGSFWLRGKPGAGKSVLVSFVINSFKKARREGEILTLFYCDFRNERSTNSAEVMRSILSQLIRQIHNHSVHLGPLLYNLTEAMEWGGGTLSNTKGLAEFASHAAKLLRQRPLVFVDALDECKDVRTLIQALMVLRDHVRLFVTSRPLRVIVDELSDFPFVSMDDMADELSADIELHVTRELDARQRLRHLDSVFKTEIRTILCDKADGMFRWVQCSIDTLDLCFTRREVRNALDNLPEGLDETYERILLAINMETRAGQLAHRALIWLVAALRPLQLSEIMEALSINLQTRMLDRDIGPMHGAALLDACGSLVTYSEKTGVVVLSHSSVKEYLLGEFTRAKLPAYYIKSEHAHLLLAQSSMCYISVCLKCLANVSDPSSIGVSSQPRLHPKSQPLINYVLDDALDHFGYLGAGSTFKSALDDVAMLAADIQRHSWTWDHVFIPGRWKIPFNSWNSNDKPHWPAAVHDLQLYILVAFASDSFMKAFFRRNTLKPKSGTNPLVYAAQFNKDEHARTLLLRGARLHHRGWETVGYCQSLPIEVAFRNRHHTMVGLFVKEGSRIPPHIFATLLLEDVDLPYSDISSVARALVQTDDFTEYTSNFLHPWSTSEAFKYTTEQDLIVIIQRIIQVADEHTTTESVKESFLCLAVAQGYICAAHYLLTLDTCLPSDIIVTLSRLGIGRWKTTSMIRFLVERGADVLAHTSDGKSALHIILWRCDGYFYEPEADEDDVLEAVRLLVDYGCDPLEASCHGDTPLHIANKSGYSSVTQYLLALGAPLPLYLFHINSWERRRISASMIRTLIGNGPNDLVFDELDRLLRLSLQTLVDDNEALEVVKSLVAHGCDPLKADSCGNTPFRIAVERGHLSVARYLLTLHAPVFPDFLVTLDSNRSWDWCTAPIIRFLVDNGADPLAHTSKGDTVLHIAVQAYPYFSGSDSKILEVTKLLVDYGCDPLGADCRGDTPFCIAVRKGHDSVARYLLAFSALPPDILFLSDGHMIRFLVENGANPLMRTSNGDSVLHVVLKHWQWECRAAETLEVLKLLVGYGCDPLEADSDGNTPLHVAVKNHCLHVAQYLVSVGAFIHPNLLLNLGYNCHHKLWTMRPMIHFLIKNGADPRLVRWHSSNGDGILHLVARMNTKDSPYREYEVLEIMKLLIDYGCDPLRANSCGHTPFSTTVEQGNISVARYLLTFGARFPPNLFGTPNHPSWRWCRAPVIHLLIESGADLHVRTNNGNSLIHITLQDPYLHSDEALEVLKILVDYGCDPLEASAHGNTPLQIAIQRGHLSVAQYLVFLGTPVPPDLLVTLDLRFSYWNTVPMIRFLVENGVSIFAHASNGDSALHMVLRCSRRQCNDLDVLEAVKLLVGYGCDPSETNFHGETPLHIAAGRNNILVARYFVTRGVSVLTRTRNGDTMLHLAINDIDEYDDLLTYDSRVVQTLEFFVGCGCEPSVPNDQGTTPLHGAVLLGRTTSIKYLISLNIPLPPDILFTAIAFCVRFARRVTFKTLVTSGCDVQLRNSEGDTPLQFAVKMGEIGIVEYLASMRNSPPLEDHLIAQAPASVRSEMEHIMFTTSSRGVGGPRFASPS